MLKFKLKIKILSNSHDSSQICTNTGQLLVASNAAVSTPNLDESHEKKNKKKDKKLKKFDEKSPPENAVNLDSSKDSNEAAQSDQNSNEELIEPKQTEELSESQLQKYTILEKCSKQYEIFYQIYLSHRLLGISQSPDGENSLAKNDTSSGNKLNYFLNDDLIETLGTDSLLKIDELFTTLKIERNCRLQKLQFLLSQSLGENDSTEDEKTNKQHTNENLKIINRLLGMKLTSSMRRSVKFVSQLLVLVSTIPNYNQNIPPHYQEEKELPPWLKVLALCAAYSKSDKDLQIINISTLFELIGIVKCQKEKLPNKDIHHLVMLPLLKYGHVTYMEQRTRIFQLLVSTLWDYLDCDKTVDLSQIAFLLYQLHSCLDSGLVERIISDRIENSHLVWSSSDLVDSDLENHDDRLSSYKLDRLDDIKIMLNLPEMSATNCSSQLTERQSIGFKKFELLWHLGREQKESFDKILLKVYDNLGLPQYISIRTFVVKWLKEALLRGDIGRLLMPLMKIMLSPSTKRISISNVHLLKIKGTKPNEQHLFDEKTADQELRKDILVENEVYVIKMEDGMVRNHLESTKRKSPMGSLPKKLFSIATKNASAGQKMRDKGLMPSTNLPTAPAISLDTDINNISLIVNPLEPLEQESAGAVSKSCPNSISTKPENKRFSDSSSEYSTTSADSMSDNEMSDDEKIKLTGHTDEMPGDTRIRNKKVYNLSRNSSDIINDDSAIGQASYDESGMAADEFFTEKHDNDANFDGADSGIDPMTKSNSNHCEEAEIAPLRKRHSKTSIDSAQTSITNRESTSEHDSDRTREAGSVISRHQQKKRKNL